MKKSYPNPSKTPLRLMNKRRANDIKGSVPRISTIKSSKKPRKQGLHGDVEAIKVTIRLKPLSANKDYDEIDPQIGRAWRVISETNTIFQECPAELAVVPGSAIGVNGVIGRFGTPSKFGTPGKALGGGGSSSHGGSQSTFSFDRVFGEESTTGQIYDDTVKYIVHSVTQRGINGTVFAYGQTSSGKTHTMIGNQQPTSKKGSSTNSIDGIVHMAARDIFDTIADDPPHEYAVYISFLEVYNEECRDLLITGDPSNRTLAVREDSNKEVFVENLTTHRVSNLEMMLHYLNIGEENKSVATTKMNDRSSRSHTIFRITVEREKRDAVAVEPQGAARGTAGKENSVAPPSASSSTKADDVKLVATLNLVDLAGSESVAHIGATRSRQKEGVKINQSLLTLSRVIMERGKVSNGGKSMPFINYRDSKLTRILQSSLSGNARMAIICCASPSDACAEETKSTLRFASRAKLATTSAAVNEISEDPIVHKKLQQQVASRSEEGKQVVRQLLVLEKSAMDAKKAASDAKEKLKKLHDFVRTSENVHLLLKGREFGHESPARRSSYMPFEHRIATGSSTVEHSAVSPRYAEEMSVFNQSSTEVTLLKDALAAKTAQVSTELENEKDRAHKRISSLEAALLELERDNQNALEESGKRIAKLEREKDKMGSELQATLAALESSKHQNKYRIAGLITDKEESDARVARLEATNSELNELVGTQTAEMEEAVACSGVLRSELDALESSKQRHEALIAELQSQSAKWKTEKESTDEKAKAQVDQLASENDLLTEQFCAIEKDMDQATARIAELKRSREDGLEQIKRLSEDKEVEEEKRCNDVAWRRRIRHEDGTSSEGSDAEFHCGNDDEEDESEYEDEGEEVEGKYKEEGDEEEEDPRPDCGADISINAASDPLASTGEAGNASRSQPKKKRGLSHVPATVHGGDDTPLFLLGAPEDRIDGDADKNGDYAYPGDSEDDVNLDEEPIKVAAEKSAVDKKEGSDTGFHCGNEDEEEGSEYEYEGEDDESEYEDESEWGQEAEEWMLSRSSNNSLSFDPDLAPSSDNKNSFCTNEEDSSLYDESYNEDDKVPNEHSNYDGDEEENNDGIGSKPTTKRKYARLSWDERLQELIEYNKQHGDCFVPRSNDQLGRWVKEQRAQYRLMQQGKPSNMTPERIAKLEGIGFEWDASHLRSKGRVPDDDKWEERFAQLIEYKEVNGDCLVPQNRHQLGRWVKEQRRQYRLMEEGKPSNMTPERMARLEDSGFVWRVRKERKR